MSPSNRPISITLLACLYIGVGTIGFAYHFPALLQAQHDAPAMELTELLAVVCGVFLLRGRNWARWLALAWIAFHVVLSAFDRLHGLIVHSVFCAAIAWLLFRPVADRYFRSARIQAA